MVLGSLLALFVLKDGVSTSEIPPKFIEKWLLILFLYYIFEQSGHEADHIRFLNETRMVYVKYLEDLVQLLLAEIVLGPEAFKRLFHKGPSFGKI